MPISPETSPPPPMSMAPMPAGQYHSREDLLAAAKDWAATQGYAIVIARSRLNRLWLKCDRGGTYRNRLGLTPEQRKRKRGDSRLLGCPFKILANIKKDGVWRLHTEVAEHTHGPSDDLSIHPTLRRLTDEQSQKVNEMTEAGNSPAETLEELKRLWPDIKVLARDIYNARKKYKTEKEMADLAAGGPPQPRFEDPNGQFPGPSATGRWEWVEDDEEVINKNRRKKRKPPYEQRQQQQLDPQLQTPHMPTRRQVAGLGHRPPRPFQRAQPIPAQSQHRVSTDGNAPGASSSSSTNNNTALLQQQQSSFASGDESSSFDRGLDDDDDESFFPSHADLVTTATNTTNTNPNLTPSHFPRPLPPQRHPPPSRLPPTTTVHASAVAASSTRPTAAPSSTNAAAPTTHSAVAAAGGPPKAQSAQVLISRIERMEREQRDQKGLLSQILGVVQGITRG